MNYGILGTTNLDLAMGTGVVKVDNGNLSYINEVEKKTFISNTSSNKRPIYLSELAKRLEKRGWNIPIRRVISNRDKEESCLPWNYEEVNPAPNKGKEGNWDWDWEEEDNQDNNNPPDLDKPIGDGKNNWGCSTYLYAKQLSLLPGFCDPINNEMDQGLGSYIFSSNKHTPKSIITYIDNSGGQALNVKQLIDKYHKAIKKMKEKEGETLYNSSKVVIDFLKNSVLVNLVTEDEYTNTISLRELESSLAFPGLIGKIDLCVKYTKSGVIHGQDLVFEAFKYPESDITAPEMPRFTSYLGDVLVEYVDGIIRVIPEALDVDECIISKCTLSYGCI